MDLVKSHIGDGFFPCSIPCSSLYASIFPQLSSGFWAHNCELYKRAGKHVTAEVSLDASKRTLNLPLFFRRRAIDVNGCYWTTVTVLFLSCLCHQHSSNLLYSLTPWTQLRWWLFWLCLWQWPAPVRLFTSKAVWTKMTSCQAAQRRTRLIAFWSWWENKSLKI